MNLSNALKQKNRLAGELVRQQIILQRENSRRSDSISHVDRELVWKKIQDLSDELGILKGKITSANIGIYPLLERMAELKSRISFIQLLEKREGDEISFIGRDQEKLAYQWNSTINQSRADELVAKIQTDINDLQDKIDVYNGSTIIS
jgi:hypothetical protein